MHDWGLASTLPVSFSPYNAKFSRAKHSSLLIVIVRFGLKYFTPGACTIKLTTAVIYGFRNKLVFAAFRCYTLGRPLALPTSIRLGWRGLPATNTLDYYENP